MLNEGNIKIMKAREIGVKELLPSFALSSLSSANSD